MKAVGLQVTSSGQTIRISCIVESSRLDTPQQLWIELKGVEQVACTADIFLGPLLLPSMAAGEDLYLEAPLSARLIRACDQIQEIYSSWVRNTHRIKVVARSVYEPAGPRATGRGSFFSGGVDSFYTLHKHRQTLTHLILVRGWDIRLDDDWRYEQTRSNVLKVATAEGKRLIEVATNIRAFMDTFVRWDYSHGGALAAAALASAGTLGTVYIPSTFPYSRLAGWGSHPLLDPLWSNGAVEIVHDGCEHGRLQKVLAAVARSPLAMETLRVCWKGRQQQYNCCRCEKCVRTMLCLYVAGVLDRCSAFPRRLSPLRVATRNFKLWTGLAEEILQAMPRRTLSDRALSVALRIALFRSRAYLAWKTLIGKA